MNPAEHNVGDLTPLESLPGLTANTLRRTEAAGLVVVADVMKQTVPQLASIGGLGKSTVANLLKVLGRYGLRPEGAYESPRSKGRESNPQKAKWRAKRGKLWEVEGQRILRIARGEEPTPTTSEILRDRTFDEGAIDELFKVLRDKSRIDFHRILLLASGLSGREQLIGEHLQLVDEINKLHDDATDLEDEIEFRFETASGSLGGDVDIYQMAFEARTLMGVNEPLAEERRRQDFPGLPFLSWEMFSDGPINRQFMLVREFLQDERDPLFQLVLDYFYKHGATQDQLATLFGKTQPTIGRYISRCRLERPLMQGLFGIIAEVEFGSLKSTWEVATNPETIRSALPALKILGKEAQVSSLAMPTAMLIDTTGRRPPAFLKAFALPCSWPEAVAPRVRVARRSESVDWVGDHSGGGPTITELYGKGFPDYLVVAEPTGKTSPQEVSTDLPDVHLEGTSGSILNYTWWPYGFAQNQNHSEERFVSCICWSSGMVTCHPPTLIPAWASAVGTDQPVFPKIITEFLDSFEGPPKSITEFIAQLA